ncbi:RNA-guided endonuclease TnpB family protein [Streptomyces violascens]|uniref:RNA-guided endonuclease TnpB family protein n=1 Tax=Streptomyces violascens TaxID=67381 RepID=UPI0016719285|nr:RNA-guided endonuclease TnpB family protein [Streptomyces violascens]GGU41392.1 hypothetical protein GCM10010289_72890 [Streptomyces violascens]
MPLIEVVRAYKFTLTPTDAQREDLARHAGACRWAYNYAIARKQAAHRAWTEMRQAHQVAGLDDAQAEALIKQAGSGLTDSITVWDHHRKMLMCLKTGKPVPQTAADFTPPAGQEVLYGRLVAARTAADAGALRAALAEARGAVNALKAQAFAAGFRVPNAMDMAALWRTERDRPREEGGSPWWGEVNVYAFTTGFDRAERAWKNWLDSCSGKRSGRRVGYPRFKRKGRAADSFALYHDVKKPTLRPDGYRRLALSTLGSIRTCESSKWLVRLIDRGTARINSVTISRGAHRWYASVLVTLQQDVPVLWEHTATDGTRSSYLSADEAYAAAKVSGGGTVMQHGQPTRRQRTGGLVGADLGSRHLAVLTSRLDHTDPASTVVAHPRHLKAGMDRLVKAQKQLSRTTKGSRRRQRAADRVARLHHAIKLRRATSIHGLTKALVTRFDMVAIEDLSLVQLTRTPRGTVADPGKNVKVKALFDRHLLDASLGEVRRQLTYKSRWYGSRLIVIDQGTPVASTCAKCGERNPSSKPGQAKFHCISCGHAVDRHENSASNIMKAARRQIAAVASGKGETQNARRAPVSPSAPRGAGRGTLKREGTI